MRIVMADDSVPFDGYTSGHQPLGGTEKAFAALASALAIRGHEVRAFNRCRFKMTIEGAKWEPWDQMRPLEADLLIAWRKVGLLTSVRQAAQRLLWVAAPGAYLERASNRELIDSTGARLVFQSSKHKASFNAWNKALPVVVGPGVRSDYCCEAPIEPASPPLAVATTHPLHGLDWLLDLWPSIRARVPAARLALYSAVLDKGRQGGEVAPEIRPVLDKALALAEAGVFIERPLGDMDMPGVWRKARVHLFPAHADDWLATTLMESQASGIPAVARPLGVAPERLIDGQTGQLVPDADAFANVAAELLSNDDLFWSMSRDAKLWQAGRGWDVVAGEIEGLVK
ncbi:MAG: glycosyltransferase [Alphaproteobacteria bacterium]|nr:glycosyltransferase [Alphaproteobacteria bacterium]